MIESARGLVVRTRPLTETSLIVHWLTSDLGRLTTVAKGARRPKSPFRGKLDLFYLADFSFGRSRRSELHTLREVNLLETHGLLRQDIGCLQQACYCAALIEQATELEEPMRGVYELMIGLIRELVQSPSSFAKATEDGKSEVQSPKSTIHGPQSVVRSPQSTVHSPQSGPVSGQAQGLQILTFELKLLKELGLRPDLEKSQLSPGTRQVVRALIENDWSILDRLRTSEPQALELRQFLHGFLIFHLGRIPKGRSGVLGLG